MIEIQIPYDDRHLAKQVPGYQWNKRNKTWCYPDEAALKIIQLFPTLNHDSNTIRLAERITASERATEEIKAGSYPLSAPSFLYEHQKKAFALCMANKSFALFMDMGTGKTLVILCIIDAKQKKTLIIAPCVLLRGAWLEDIRTFFPGMEAKTLIFHGTKAKRAKMDLDKYMVVITSYETYRIEQERLMAADFEIIVGDESSRCKDARAKTTKAIDKHAKMVEHVYLLSGTPAPNTPFEFFSQMKMIDPTLLGDSFYKFRLKFGYMVNDYQWVMPKDNQDVMMDLINKKAIFVDKDDCLDLPDVVHTKIPIPFLKNQLKVYEDMMNDFRIEFEDTDVNAFHIISQLMKLREITSGFVIDGNGAIVNIGSDKYDRLEELLADLGKEQCIIWCNFKEEIRQIATRLGDRARTYYGETPGGERDGIVQGFKHKEFRYLIAHPQSIGHGITFAQCRYAIYFSMSHSYELYAQSHDRIHRMGQTRKCQIFHLLTENSIDEQIYAAVARKEKVSDRLLEMIK